MYAQPHVDFTFPQKVFPQGEYMITTRIIDTGHEIIVSQLDCVIARMSTYYISDESVVQFLKDVLTGFGHNAVVHENGS